MGGGGMVRSFLRGCDELSCHDRKGTKRTGYEALHEHSAIKRRIKQYYHHTENRASRGPA